VVATGWTVRLLNPAGAKSFVFCKGANVTQRGTNERGPRIMLSFLGAFAKLRKVIITFDMSVRLSVRLEQLSFHWMVFHLIFGYFSNIRGENSSFIKIQKEQQVLCMKTH
jgi:hypothetical protein